MEDNKGRPEAELLRVHMNDLRVPAKGEARLRGVYLPYRLFQGPFSFTVRRAQGSEREFAGESFLSHKAIVTSDNLPNDLLDRVEPILLTVLLYLAWLGFLMAWEFVVLPAALLGWMLVVRGAICSYPYVRPLTGGAWRIVEDATPITARIKSALGDVKRSGCGSIFFLIFILALLLLGPAFTMVYEL